MGSSVYLCALCGLRLWPTLSQSFLALGFVFFRSALQRDAMKLFGDKKRDAPSLVTAGRFELERDGHVATLDYTLAGDVLALLETQVPESLRGTGIAGMLARTALDYAREHHLRVDVICPFVADYLATHPEYSE